MCGMPVRTIAVVVSEPQGSWAYPLGGGGGGAGGLTYTYTYPTYSATSKEYRLRGRWFDMSKQQDGTYTVIVYATDDDTELVGQFPRALRAYFTDALASGE